MSFQTFAQLIVNGLIAGATYALVAIGYGLIYGTLRFVNFAHGTVGMVGAYIVYWLAVSPLHLPFGLAVVLGIFLSAMVGVITELVAYRPFRGVSWLAPIVTAIAVSLIIQAVLIMVTGARYLNYGFPILRGWSLGPILVTKVQLTIVLASLSLMLAIYALLNFTKLGKAMRAVADDADLCEVSGIDSNFIIDCVFAVGSASAGAAGILMGLDTILTHTMGIQMTIKAFAAVILGGLGSVQGAVAGGFLLGIGENIGVWFLPSVWKDSIAFGIMTIGLYLKPTGLFGKAGEAMVLGK